jgi:hypothetical protein
MWIAALVIAASLITYSTWLYVQANPRDKLPWIGRATNEPSQAVMCRLAGLFVGLIGGMVLTPDDLRGWFGLGALLMLLPTVILQGVHNARVKD